MIKNTIVGFQIQEQLLQGEDVVIYRAIRDKDNKKVILKTLQNDYPTPSEIALITKEYKTLNNLKIAGVVKPLEMINHSNKNKIIISEDFNGIALSKYINDKRGSLIDFLRIAIKITDALCDIHGENIMHKGINPENILINPTSLEIKIIYFGASTPLSLEHANPYNYKKKALHYISPEQTGRMNRSTDYRTDLYSLGMTFYEMLMGEVPFMGNDPMEIIYGHIAKKIEPLTTKNPKIPTVLSKIILKLTEKIADNRYQTAIGLKHDLNKSLEFLKKQKAIPLFTIGQNDVNSKFRISDNLYGREQEIQTLLKAYNAVEKGACNLLLIDGFSGIGKTALVNEIHKPTVLSKGYFISGKFDQYKSNSPFHAFSLAFADLVKYLINEPEERLTLTKNKLKAALGLNAPILVELVPEFELIIGQQTSYQKLNPIEAQNRFFFTLIEFIKVFATKEQPLSIFIDDLQWSDDASLSLLKELILREIPNLFIIGAYRYNEVEQGHPLLVMIDTIKKSKTIDEIHLEALQEKDVNQLIADTLFSSLDDIKHLGKIVFKRTGGNPFYIDELLKTIHHNKHIFFNHKEGKWNWNIDKIIALDLSSNVIELMTSRLKEFDANCLELLQLAACIGNTFHLKTLSLASGKSASELSTILWSAVLEEIIIPTSESYLYIYENEDFNVAYKFQHDRIQQSAYLMVEEKTRKKLHLKIGKILLEHLTPAKRDERLIEIVRHINEGINEITDPKEKDQLAELNLMAGKKSQDAIAYSAALNYFNVGISLLPENNWLNKYETSIALYTGFAQNAYQVQQFSEAEEAIDLLLEKTKTKLEKVKILSMRLRQYTTIGKTEEAIDLGIEGLALLGYKLPKNPSALTLFKEVLLAKWNLGKRKAADLIQEKILSDPEKLAAARLFTEIGPSAYVLGNSNLYGLTGLKVVNLSLVHGNCPESSFAYISFGAVLADAFGDYKAAEDFGQLALNLNKKLNNIEYRCRVIAAYGVLTHHYNNHWSSMSEYFKKGVSAGYTSGDLFFLAYCAKYISIFDPNLELTKAIYEQNKYLKVIKNTGYQDALNSSLMEFQVLKNMNGKTVHNLTLNDDTFDEAVCLESMTNRNFLSGIGMYHFNKSKIHLVYDDYKKAWESAKETYKYSKSLFSLIYLNQLSHITFFACSGYYLTDPNAPKKELKKTLKRELKKMRKWAAHNPINFEHWLLLMEAEWASIEQKTDRATQLYEQAINTANKNKWLSSEAFANELAAKFYLRNNIHTAATDRLNRAYDLYRKWEAFGKTKFLAEKYPNLLSLSISQKEKVKDLDVATITKSSQAISEIIELDALLTKMMQIAMLNAGAAKGLFLLAQNEQLYIQASAIEEEVEIVKNIQVNNFQNIPKTVIDYVSNLREYVLLDEATIDERFKEDSYIKKHQTKSILCIPILSRKEFYGIIYLENNNLIGAFTEDRFELLKMLSTQMAISIRNAQLYASLDEKVKERTKKLHELNATKDKFFGIIAHDIRSPIVALDSVGEQMEYYLQKNDTAKLKRLAGRVDTTAKSLSKLLDNLLQWAMLQQGVILYNPTVLKIKDIGQETIDMFLANAEAKSIVLENTIDDTIFINADLHAIHTILRNLISNAIKFTKAGGSITLHAEPKNDLVTISIIDTGIGMTPEKVATLFQLDKKSELGTKGEKGTGLGLNLVKELTEMNKGRIEVFSELGKGTQFNIILPKG